MFHTGKDGCRCPDCRAEAQRIATLEARVAGLEAKLREATAQLEKVAPPLRLKAFEVLARVEAERDEAREDMRWKNDALQHVLDAIEEHEDIDCDRLRAAIEKGGA